MVDKNQAVIDFLFTCPKIADSRLFFNFINGKANDKQIITSTNDVAVQKPFIDGSIMKRYTFTVVDFRAITSQAIVNVPSFSDVGTTTTVPTTDYKNQNVEEMLDVQGIMDWITEQAEARNFPNFGSDCIVDNMFTTSDNPNLNGVDRNSTPAIAKYSMSIQIDYVDNTKKIWN